MIELRSSTGQKEDARGEIYRPGLHAASTTIAVVGPSGKVLRTEVVETSGQALIEALTRVPGKLHVCLEEGTQSAWLCEILLPLDRGAQECGGLRARCR
jgi:hypothetical protein